MPNILAVEEEEEKVPYIKKFEFRRVLTALREIVLGCSTTIPNYDKYLTEFVWYTIAHEITTGNYVELETIFKIAPATMRGNFMDCVVLNPEIKLFRARLNNFVLAMLDNELLLNEFAAFVTGPTFVVEIVDAIRSTTTAPDCFLTRLIVDLQAYYYEKKNKA